VPSVSAPVEVIELIEPLAVPLVEAGIPLVVTFGCDVLVYGAVRRLLP